MAREVKPCPRQKVTDLGKYYFDSEAAERIVQFFDEFIPHTTGPTAGQPFKLLDWQKEMLRTLFGWKRKKDGYRRFRKLFLLVPKKNGKSTLSAGLALYLTGFDGEFNAKVFCAATEKEQAKIVFDEAKTMIELSPALGEVFTVVKNCITCAETKSSFVPVSSDTKGRHGVNISGCICDEIHALRDAELYEVLTRGSGAARKQPLFIAITTAGSDRNSIAYSEYEHALQVITDETVDEQLLAVVFEPAKTDDWRDPKVWAKVNPSMDVTLSEEFLEQECKLAKQNPRNENTFRKLHLNQWLSAVTRWLSTEDWSAAARKYTEANLRGKPAYGGLDLSCTQDLTALGLLFPEPDLLYSWVYLFMPEDRVDEAKERDGVPFRRWVNEGHIIATPGNVVHYDAVVQKMADAKAFFDLREIGFDPYNATMAVQQAEKLGIKMVPVAQNYPSISQPSKEMERRLIGRTFGHQNNPALNWMADNIEVRTGPNGVIAPNKPAERAGRQKRIDGVVSLIIAMNRVLTAKPAESIYKKRGIISI